MKLKMELHRTENGHIIGIFSEDEWAYLTGAVGITNPNRVIEAAKHVKVSRGADVYYPNMLKMLKKSSIKPEGVEVWRNAGGTD